MKLSSLAATSVLVGFALGAGSAWAHGPNGHGKSTVEQCQRILDPAVQAECLSCIAQEGRAFFPRAQGDARCAEDHHH